VLISVGRRYVQLINRTYGCAGTLWGGRYKSSLVQAETYLLFCQRYIELNPVRAGMVADPAECRWSSYRANALGQPDALLAAHPLCLALGADEEARRAAYHDLFRIVLEEAPLTDLRMALNQDQPIGNHRFYREIEAMTGKRQALRQRADHANARTAPQRTNQGRLNCLSEFMGNVLSLAPFPVGGLSPLFHVAALAPRALCALYRRGWPSPWRRASTCRRSRRSRAP
jgi:hypothetical protein